MIGLGLMTALLVAQVISSLASWAGSFKSTHALVEGKTQRFALWRLCHTARRDVNGA